MVVTLWKGLGYYMVIFLAGLQGISADLYEAARVDGASRWQRFRHVILPQLKPALLPAVILGTVWTFNMFNIVYLVSGGEPDGAADVRNHACARARWTMHGQTPTDETGVR